MFQPHSLDESGLTSLIVDPALAATLLEGAADLPSITLGEPEEADLELLATGAFTPVASFMGSRELETVLDRGRLPGGELFPIPILLPVDDPSRIKLGHPVALRDRRGDLLATMTVEDVFQVDRENICRAVTGTFDSRHPYTAYWSNRGRYCVAGRPDVVALPKHRDFQDLRLTPLQVRARLAEMGIERLAAFQTRNPIHRAHEALLWAALRKAGALLIHPVVARTKPGDVDASTRVRSYRALHQAAFRDEKAILAVLPLAMRFAGPKEAVWHAIIRRNYGATHFIVGRDHASPGTDSNGRPFYDPKAAREAVDRHAEEIGIEVLSFDEFVYCADDATYREISALPPTAKTMSISGTEAREEYLEKGRPLPEWFTRPEVAEVLADAYEPRHRQGVCVWFTGLSGSGKSTTAEVVVAALEEAGRRVTLLDGDVVRTHLSKGLGFSPEDRDTNIRRIGFVAAEIVRHGGIAVCAAISPFRATRDEVRSMMEEGRFIEVFVDTPLDECESRDPKGMYRLARAGQLRDFTGVDSPYEAPENCEIRIDGAGSSAAANGDLIVRRIRELGFIR